MARVLNEEEQQRLDSIEEHDLYVKLEIKHNLLIKAVQNGHKIGLFHKFFNRKCEICKVMGVIVR